MPGHCELIQSPHVAIQNVLSGPSPGNGGWLIPMPCSTSKAWEHRFCWGISSHTQTSVHSPEAEWCWDGQRGDGNRGNQNCQLTPRSLCCAWCCPWRDTARNTHPGWKQNTQLYPSWATPQRATGKISASSIYWGLARTADSDNYRGHQNKDVPKVLPAGAVFRGHPKRRGTLSGKALRGRTTSAQGTRTPKDCTAVWSQGCQRCPRNKLLTGSQGRLDPQLLSFSSENLIGHSKFSFSPKALNVWCMFAICIQLCFNPLLVSHKPFPSGDNTRPVCWSKGWWWGAAPYCNNYSFPLCRKHIHLAPPASQITPNCRNFIYTKTIKMSACQHSS